MKKIFILFLLLISMTTFSQENVGYLVSINIDSISRTEIYEIDSLNIVSDVFYYYSGVYLDLCNVFVDDIVFFEFRHNHVDFYCEKKRIINKKNGKVVFKKIKKKK